MNRPIRTMAIACLVFFLLLLGNVTWVQFFEAGSLNADRSNRRVLNEQFNRQRGAILVSGSAVAESVPSTGYWSYQRTYANGPLYAPVTGYFSYFNGLSGLENSQNAILSGADDRLFVDRVVDLLGNKKSQGGSVSTTINPAAQAAAQDGLRALGKDTIGAVVALEPSTGKILAMVSQPSYDPNVLASQNISGVNSTIEQLQADPTQPMLNRTSALTLPPGSTFKLVTAAAAIKDLGLTPTSVVRGGATLPLPETNTPLTNENRSNCGGDKITFQQALEVSCNVSFGDLAMQLGQDRLTAQAKAFGFTQKPITSIASVPSRVTTTPDQQLNQAQLAQTGIGQFDVAATPLQMAMVAAAVGNSGTVMQPYLVDTQLAPNLKVIGRTKPKAISQAMTPTNAAMLRDMMVGVVNNGTARPVQIPGVQVAAKTGTAESGVAGKAPYAWFVCFAPAQNPQIAVAVLIESTQATTNIAGGQLGGPIARRVIQAAIQ